MKKMFLIVTAILFSSFLLLQAQETHFGLKAGLNSSSISYKNATDYDSKLGVHLGALAHIHVNRHFAVQPEVVFSMQGGETDNDKVKANYVNIPVLAQYMFDGGFRLQTGPQIGFLVSSERELNHVETDLDDRYNTIDFSWTIGASYLFPGTGFGLDARYNHGINDIDEMDVYEARNRVIQVGIFYQFMHNNAAKRK